MTKAEAMKNLNDVCRLHFKKERTTMRETTAMVCISIAKSLGCLACLGISGYLAHNKLDGWGWFLFAAILLGGYSVSFKD